jgi:thiamine pyrophosphate-dependent acetolactate synthase large subunit-like protein
MRPITKWAFSIPYVDKVQEAVRKAFRVALAEPQGPTHIEAASEVLLQQTTPQATAPAAYRNTVPAVCDPAQLDAAWALISKAERPLFVIGRGVMKENAVAAMQKLTEATGIPAAALQYSPDAFPAAHAPTVPRPRPT